MSYLSDLVRTLTGGEGVGETTGRFIGGTFGGPAGAEAGARIGGQITQAIDMDTTEGQATARDISPNLPSETGMSGSQTVPYLNIPVYPGQQQAYRGAGFGMIGPGLALGGRVAQALRTPGGAATAGGLAVAAADFVTDFFGNTKKLVITRKMQREVKELYMYMNADLNAVAAAYSQYKGMNFSAAMIQKILLKRFRNDGPYITKAAIRKTRTTVRKLERLEALKKQITGTRAAPRRRAAATTRITQVK